MSYMVRVKVDGKWITVFRDVSHDEANRLKGWLEKWTYKSEKVRVVPTLRPNNIR